jgi:hypothetical protein
VAHPLGHELAVYFARHAELALDVSASSDELGFIAPDLDKHGDIGVVDEHDVTRRAGVAARASWHVSRPGRCGLTRVSRRSVRVGDDW